MFRKIVLCLLLIIFPSVVMASANSTAMVGGKYYDSFEDAVRAAGSDDIVKLISDVKFDDTFVIDKTVNINLNGNDITAPSNVFKVKGGVLNINGTGIIRETEPNYGAITVIGSDKVSDSNYSIVNVGSDVKLEGWSGIFITHDSNKSYGVVVNLDGDINAVNDAEGGTGIGVYVNGNIKDDNNAPVVNIGDDVEITSTGNGLYIAGYATFNIGKAYIEGDESGIGIKAGRLNIDGATVLSEGIDKTPTLGYNNGIKASGTAIQVESNSGYAGDIGINILDGTFRSKHSYVFYEYIGKGTSTQVNNINISGGTFRAEGSKPVFGVSDIFKNKHSSFISGGRYTSNPNEYLKSGYNAHEDDGFYVVTSSTSKLVSGDSVNIDDGSGVLKIIAVIVISSIVLILGYMNKDRIIDLFRK